MPFVWGGAALMDYINAHSAHKGLKWVVLPIFFLWLFGVPWFANKTAEYIAFHDLNFFKATSATFSDLRCRLSFLPITGAWFAPKNDDKHDDQND